MQLLLDQYGDSWREFHRAGRQLSTEDREALNIQWRTSIAVIKSIASKTTAVLTEIRQFDTDIALDDAYVSLQESLVKRVGVLDRLARMAPPNNPERLSNLVDQEESLLHLRSEARGALESVNHAIKAIED